LVNGEINELVLDCYRLARWYHQSPATFLDMPLSEVQQHLLRTIELAKINERAAAAAASGDDDG